MCDRWPKPVSLQRKNVKKARGGKTLRHEALYDLIAALRRGERVDHFKSKEDRLNDYLKESAGYGFSHSMLSTVLNTEVDHWFVSLLTEKNQNHKHTKIEIAKNPYEKAAAYSGNQKKNAEPQIWIVRAMIGPFDSVEEAKKTSDLWKDQKIKRLEMGESIAETAKKNFYYGRISDFEAMTKVQNV